MEHYYMRLGSMVHSSGLALTRLELLRVRTLGAFVTAITMAQRWVARAWLCGRREGGRGETKPRSGDSHGYTRPQK